MRAKDSCANDPCGTTHSSIVYAKTPVHYVTFGLLEYNVMNKWLHIYQTQSRKARNLASIYPCIYLEDPLESRAGETNWRLTWNSNCMSFIIKTPCQQVDSQIVQSIQNNLGTKSKYPKESRNQIISAVRALLEGSSPATFRAAGGAFLKKRELSCVLANSVQVALPLSGVPHRAFLKSGCLVFVDVTNTWAAAMFWCTRNV